MSALILDRVQQMSEAAEPNTRTVRIATELAKKLQTISALGDEMGQKFKPVEFLDGLIRRAIEERYAATVAAFAEFQAKQKGKKKS